MHNRAIATAGILAVITAGELFMPEKAFALTCPSYTYTFSNGTTADATQVNANFSTIASCANTLLAPLNSPSFTGQSGFGTIFTNTSSSDDVSVVSVVATLAPSAASSSDFRSLNMSATYDATGSFATTGADAPTAGWFESRIINSGTIAETAAGEFWGIWAGSDAASLGTVSLVQAAKFTPVQSFGNSLTTTITEALGVHVVNSTKNTFVLTGQAGVSIDPLSGATNNTAVLIGTTTIPTGSFGIYNASTNANYLAGNLGIGTSAPGQALEVNGKVKVDSFGSATSSTVCQLSGVLSSCSSSIRYKENVKTATFGLKEIEEMRPVTFKWKGRNENDIGLIAEEVAKINPLFASYKDGKVEGVKYAQLTAVLVNAIKELQQKNEIQESELASLQLEVKSFKQSQQRAAVERTHGSYSHEAPAPG